MIRRHYIRVSYLRHHGYLEEMKVLFLVARIFTLLPLQISRDSQNKREGYKVRFKKWSLIFLYSAILYIVVSFFSSVHLLQRARTMTSTMNVSFYLSVAYVVSVFLIPLTHWRRSCIVVEYLHRWSEFEATYWRVTGTTLKLNLKFVAKLSSVIFSIASILMVTSQLWIQPGYKLWYVPIVSYAVICKGTVELIWILTFFGLTEASRNVTTCMTDCLYFVNKSVHETRLLQYRILWTKLSTLTKRSGEVLYPAYVVTFFVNFVILTLCFYAVISGYAESIFLRINLLIQGIICLSLLYININVAHKTSNEVTFAVQKELLRLSDNDVSIAVLSQVNEFLTEKAMNLPAVSLGDYVLINKEFFFTILGTILTYLVVLLQVRISI